MSISSRFLCSILLLVGTAAALAEEEASTASTSEGVAADAGTTEMAKTSQNPLGSIISVPLENNFYFGIGPSSTTGYVLSMKPVYPVNFGEINLINRFIIPVIYGEGQDVSDLADAAGVDSRNVSIGFTSAVGPVLGSEFGLGDITWQGFLTPANPGKVIFGAGPALTFPTHSSDRFGTDKWSAGPAVVVLAMPGNWVVGGLAQQSWSYAGPNGEATVSKATFQYFLNYNFGDGWYLTSSPIFSANWRADSGQRWTVPLGGGVGKLHKFGKLPIDFKLAAYYNVEKPTYSPDWQLQFTIKFLFPK